MSLTEIVDQVYPEMADHIGSGKVADYIPALANIDPEMFGLAVVGCDGDTACAGDADETFSIQSVSKVFTLTLALEKSGEALWERVGCEPTGSPFNSIVQPENEAGIPRNPLINTGPAL